MEIDLVYYYTVQILVVGLFIKSCEYVYTIKFFSKGNIFDYSIIGIDMFQTSSLGNFFNKIYSKKGVLSLVTGSMLLTIILLIVDFNGIVYKSVLSLFILMNLLLYYRHSYGLDGADQMSLLILVTTLLCFTFIDIEIVKKIGIYFIAIQLSLSYTVAGIAKLVSKQWRSGKAIEGILSTYTYGTNFTRNILTKNIVLCKIICWSTILIEIFFPLCLLFSPDITLYCIGFGLLFHLSIAIVMGLNDFVWSFAAAYPAFYFLSLQI